jgi:hypothetical protein
LADDEESCEKEGRVAAEEKQLWRGLRRGWMMLDLMVDAENILALLGMISYT